VRRSASLPPQPRVSRTSVTATRKADAVADIIISRPISRAPHRLSRCSASLPDLLEPPLDRSACSQKNNKRTISLSTDGGGQSADELNGNSDDEDGSLRLDTLDQFPVPPHAITTPNVRPRFPIIRSNAVPLHTTPYKKYAASSCTYAEQKAGTTVVAGRQRLERSFSSASNASFSRPSAIAYGYDLAHMGNQYPNSPGQQTLTPQHIRAHTHPPIIRTRPIYNSLPHMPPMHQFSTSACHIEQSITHPVGSIVRRPSIRQTNSAWTGEDSPPS